MASRAWLKTDSVLGPSVWQQALDCGTVGRWDTARAAAAELAEVGCVLGPVGEEGGPFQACFLMPPTLPARRAADGGACSEEAASPWCLLVAVEVNVLLALCLAAAGLSCFFCFSAVLQPNKAGV